MGNVGDIEKALKEHKFKLVTSKKHLVYQNPEGRVIRIHLGNKLTDMMYRTVMKDIARGSIKSGKVAKGQRPPAWTKEGPKCYVLHRGNVEIGRAVQTHFEENVWLWETRSPTGDAGAAVNTLAEAKEILEGL